MKQIYLLVLVTFITIGHTLKAQEAQSASVRYIPEGNGYELVVPFVWKFINCYGEIHVTISKQEKQITSDAYRYNGVRYTPADLAMSSFTNPEAGVTDIAAEVYHHSRLLGTVHMTNVINWFGGCIGQTYHIAEDLGINDADYRENLSALSLRNLRIDEIYSNDAKIEGKIETMLKEKEYQAKLQEGDRLYSQGNFKAAIQQYEEALRTGFMVMPESKADSIRAKIRSIKEELKAQEKRQTYEKHMQRGDALKEQNKLDEAATEYRKASALYPDDDRSSQALEEVRAQKEQLTQQKTAEEETRRKKQEEEVKTSERERQRQYEEARARQERLTQYNKQRMEQLEHNLKSASKLGTSALLLHYMLAKIIYSNIGYDKINQSMGELNFHKGDSWMTNWSVGYGIVSAPIFTNSRYEVFDGSDYHHTEETEGYEAATLELQVGLEAWPLFGYSHGGGFFAGLGFGHGVLFQAYSFSMQAGLRGFVGFEHFKIFGEYSAGARSFSHNPWIDNNELGEGGNSQYTYQRIKVGPRFSWTSNFNGKTTTHLDLLPLFEIPDFQKLPYGASPMIIRLPNGLHAGLYFQNRLRIYFEYLANYRRTGDVEYGYASDVTYAGAFYRLGVVRHWDSFGETAYSFGNYQRTRRSLMERNKIFVHILNPGLSWIKPEKPESGVGDSDQYYYSPRMNFSANLIGVEREINFSQNVAGVLSGDISAFRGGRINRYENGDEEGYAMINLEALLGCRIYTQPYNMKRYWLSLGLNNSIKLAAARTTRDVGTTGTGGDFEFEFNRGSEFNSYLPSLQLGVGLDYIIAHDIIARTGLSYILGSKDILKDDPQGTALSSQALTLLFGLSI